MNNTCSVCESTDKVIIKRNNMVVNGNTLYAQVCHTCFNKYRRLGYHYMPGAEE